jgi:MBG domain-containing protein
LRAANYRFVFTPGTLIVNKASLVVKAVPISKTYGSKMPSFTWQVSGFVNGDTAANLTGTPNLTSSATGASAVGSYAITVASGTLSSPNYICNFVSATLTVVKATLIVTANSQSLVYGGSVPSLTYSFTGFVNGDGVAHATSGTPVIKTTAVSQPAVGSYPISLSVGSLVSANYSFVFVSGTLTVTKAVLSVTASNASMTYGVTLPAFSYVATGLVRGDTMHTAFSGTPALAAAATSATKPGSYAIQPSLGSLVSANYSFVYKSGVLTIGKATLKVTPNVAVMTYGAAIPTLTYSMTGFVNGDTQARTSTGLPQLTTTAKAGAAVGSYPITAVSGTLAAANYTFQFVAGALTVQKAVLTVTANNLSMKEGTAVPALTYAEKGFVNGDTAASAIKGAPKVTTTATSASKPGNYAVTIAVGAMTSANYQLAMVNGTLTITQ